MAHPETNEVDEVGAADEAIEIAQKFREALEHLIRHAAVGSNLFVGLLFDPHYKLLLVLGRQIRRF